MAHDNLPECYEPGEINGKHMKICKWYDSQCCIKMDFPMLLCELVLDKIKPDWREK